MGIQKSLFFLIGILLFLSESQFYGYQNPLAFSVNEVVEVKKAQIYLEKELDLYSRRKSDNYTLFLAVKNYATRLYNLELNTLNRMGNRLQSTIGNSFIGKILLGSSHNKQNYSFAKETSLSSSKQYLYLRDWRIDLNKVFQIQNDPSAALSKVSKRRYLQA